MKKTGRIRKSVLTLIVFLVLLTTSAAAQVSSFSARPFASNIIIPQSRAFPLNRSAVVEITRINAGVVILEQADGDLRDLDCSAPVNGEGPRLGYNDVRREGSPTRVDGL